MLPASKHASVWCHQPSCAEMQESETNSPQILTHLEDAVCLVETQKTWEAQASGRFEQWLRHSVCPLPSHIPSGRVTAARPSVQGIGDAEGSKVTLGVSPPHVILSVSTVLLLRHCA